MVAAIISRAGLIGGRPHGRPRRAHEPQASTRRCSPAVGALSTPMVPPTASTRCLTGPLSPVLSTPVRSAPSRSKGVNRRARAARESGAGVGNANPASGLPRLAGDDHPSARPVVLGWHCSEVQEHLDGSAAGRRGREGHPSARRPPDFDPALRRASGLDQVEGPRGSSSGCTSTGSGESAAGRSPIPLMSSTSSISPSRCRPALRISSTLSPLFGRQGVRPRSWPNPHRIQGRSELVAHPRQELALSPGSPPRRLRACRRAVPRVSLGDVPDGGQDQRLAFASRSARVRSSRETSPPSPAARSGRGPPPSAGLAGGEEAPVAAIRLATAWTSRSTVWPITLPPIAEQGLRTAVDQPDPAPRRPPSSSSLGRSLLTMTGEPLLGSRRSAISAQPYSLRPGPRSAPPREPEPGVALAQPRACLSRPPGSPSAIAAISSKARPICRVDPRGVRRPDRPRPPRPRRDGYYRAALDRAEFTGGYPPPAPRRGRGRPRAPAR